MSEYVIHPLKPIYDEESKVLILGSFSSIISRKEMFYYANKTNRFWKVLEQIYEEEIIDKEAFCHKHHIALWDVLASCTIHGSSDASITNVKVNNISNLISKTKVQVIFTTGNKASSIYERYLAEIQIQHIRLPSTSSANAKMKLNDLVEHYKVIKELTDEKN